MNTDVTTIHNTMTLAEDGWAQLAVYGDFPGKALTKDAAGQVQRADAIQRITRASADAMARHFNSPWGKIKRFMRGCFIFNGHPDIPQPSTSDLQRSTVFDLEPKGMIAGLEAREDGLYCLPVFSAEGKAMIENAKLHFSAAWSCIQDTVENGLPIFRPDRLISVGLTPTPNLPVHVLNSAPGTAGDPPAAVGDSPTASDPSLPSQLVQPPLVRRETSAPTLSTFTLQPSTAPKTTAPKTMDKTKLIAALGDRANGITTDTPDHEIASTISILVANADTTEASLATARAELASAKAATKTEREERIKALITNAITTGRISAAEAPVQTEKLRADFINASKTLELLIPKLKTTAETRDMGGRKLIVNTSESSLQKFHRMVAEKQSHGMQYHDAFNQVLAEHSQLLDPTAA